jgi:hypothetical protein
MFIRNLAIIVVFFYLAITSVFASVLDVLDGVVSAATKTRVTGLLEEWGSKDAALLRFETIYNGAKDRMISDKRATYEELIRQVRGVDFSKYDEMCDVYRNAPFIAGKMPRSDTAKEALGWMNMMDTLSGEDVWKLSNFLRDIQSINNKEKSADIVKLKNKAKDMGSPSAIDWAKESEEDEGIVDEE